MPLTPNKQNSVDRAQDLRYFAFFRPLVLMKYSIIILSFFLGCNLTAQVKSNLYIDFESYGLGSSVGQVDKIYSVANDSLYASFISRHQKDNLDTIYDSDYVYQDSVWRRDTLKVRLRKSSLDSIASLIPKNTDTIVEINPCIKSGALYKFIINYNGRSKVFEMYNSFDSTALNITNILQTYLPDNAIDPRPIDSWLTAQKCLANLRRIKEEYEKKSK